MKIVVLDIDDIYIPAARRKEYSPEKAELIAEEILNGNDATPILVRKGNGRHVLVDGIDKLEAMKLLGESNIQTHIVRAIQH